jgi:methyl-accepting chemotaxis protein
MLLRNLKIGKRAGLIFGLLAVMALLMGAINFYQTSRMDGAATEIRHNWLPAVVALSEIGTHLGNIRALTLLSVMENGRSEQLSFINDIKNELQLLNDVFAIYEDTIGSELDRRLYNGLIEAYEAYRGAQEKVFSAMANGRMDEAERLVSGLLSATGKVLTQALKALVDFNAKQATDAAQHIGGHVPGRFCVDAQHRDAVERGIGHCRACGQW